MTVKSRIAGLERKLGNSDRLRRTVSKEPDETGGEAFGYTRDGIARSASAADSDELPRDRWLARFGNEPARSEAMVRLAARQR